MGLINDDGEIMVADITNPIADVREFLDCGDDNTLLGFDGLLQLVRRVGVSDYLLTLTKCLDIASDLAIQQAAVCDHYD